QQQPAPLARPSANLLADGNGFCRRRLWTRLAGQALPPRRSGFRAFGGLPPGRLGGPVGEQPEAKKHRQAGQQPGRAPVRLPVMRRQWMGGHGRSSLVQALESVSGRKPPRTDWFCPFSCRRYFLLRDNIDEIDRI